MDVSYLANKRVPTARDFWPNGNTLFEDTFDDGDLNGWTWLMDNITPIPGPVWCSRRTMRGSGCMLLETGDVLRTDASGFGTATAIKRLTLPMNEDGSFYPLVESEYFYGWSANDLNNPSVIQFGLDTQRPDMTDHRNYYKIRFENYDQTIDARTGKFKLFRRNPSTGAGEYIDIPGADKFSYFNEAKAGFFHIRFTVNIATQYYVSMWINGKKFDLSTYQCGYDGYVNNGGGTYDYGMNFSVDLLNRLNTAVGIKRNAKLFIPYARGAIS